MRKIALTITVTTLVLGVFGAFFRWLQLMNAFDKETGFYISGAGITAVVVVYCVLAAIAFCLLMAMWLSRYDRAESAETALKCGTAVPLVISWVFCAAFVAASCVLLFSAGASQTPLLQRLFGTAPELARPMLVGLLELGSGAAAMEGLPLSPAALSLAALLTGWGGLAVYFQTRALLVPCKAKGALHIAGHLFSAGIGAALAYLAGELLL